MARPQSDDLGEKFLSSCEATFQVSIGWAKQIWKAKRGTDRTERPPRGPPGFPSRLTPEVRLRLAARIGQKPDATLMELRDWLQKRESIAVRLQRPSAVILWVLCLDICAVGDEEPLKHAEHSAGEGGGLFECAAGLRS